MDDTKQKIKQFILDEFLPGENPDELTTSTPLITDGILDSLATLRLVSFLESEFNIELQPHEAGIDYLNTINEIANLVENKRKI